MKVIVTRQFLNGREIVHEGTELAVTEARAKALMKNNLVTPAPSELGAGTVRTRRAAQPGAAAPTQAAKPAAPVKVPVAPARSTPSATRRIGGRTGAAKQSSSSRQGRQRTARRSTKAAAAPAT
jgi:hypothetical protein